MTHQLKAHPQEGTPVSEPAAFAELGLSERALAAIRRAGFTTPTDIQREFIPAAMTGRDCIGQARTGTGKTAAFLLPLFEHYMAGEKTRALILAPTRELAAQIKNECDLLAGKLPPRSTAVYGGQPMKKQITHLATDPDIVVGTPGRILDHAGRRTMHLSHYHIVILDEVDRMFDMGFRKDIADILSQCRNRKQTLFLSATMPADIMRLAEKHLKDPIRVSVVDASAPTAARMEQRYLSVAPNRKRSLLKLLLDREKPERCIIFTRTKHAADDITAFLRDEGIEARGIHGDLTQEKRERALKKFRDGVIPVVVATDVMGRGIDVPDVTHIINYNIPENPEDYLHRIGRSARMDKAGKAFTFVSQDEGRELTEIEMRCNILIERDEVEGFDSGISGPPSTVSSALGRRPAKPGARMGGRSGGGRPGGGRPGGRPGGGRPRSSGGGGSGGGGGRGRRGGGGGPGA